MDLQNHFLDNFDEHLMSNKTKKKKQKKKKKENIKIFLGVSCQIL